MIANLWPCAKQVTDKRSSFLIDLLTTLPASGAIFWMCRGDALNCLPFDLSLAPHK